MHAPVYLRVLSYDKELPVYYLVENAKLYVTSKFWVARNKGDTYVRTSLGLTQVYFSHHKLDNAEVK